MIWALVGLVYAGVYAALISALAGYPYLRLIIGNVALLLPPIAPLVVIVRSRRRWTGRQAVFWTTIATWAALWLLGQVGWAADEVLRGSLLPWFKWHLLLQLCASALPLVALVAKPHRRAPADSAVTATLDIAVLAFLSGFLYWSLVIAPGTEPAQSDLALRLLAIVGPSVRLAAILGLGWSALDAGKNAWADVYKRLALGMILAFIALVGVSLVAVRGEYQTGSLGDIGWMLPFWFAAWAARTSPGSPVESRSGIIWTARHASPALLFAGILVVPVVGFSLRYLMPAGEHVDRLRELATAATMVSGVALIMLRLRVEQRAVAHANQGVRLLATACEQAGELIVIVRGERVEYANDAFCRTMGYSRDDLEHLTPIQLIAPEARPEVPALRERIRGRQTVRASTVLMRRDGSKFPADWTATPMLDSSGKITAIVGVVRDLTEDLRLREQLVRGERMSAVGEFVAGVAHELNNPLQSVIGTLELVLDQNHEPGVRADLERARLEAGRAGRIIRNLLTFVRQSPSERLLTSLNEIVQSTIGVRAYELEMAGIEVREEYAPNLPVVLADREEIQQVVLNLIINAQQAMVDAHGRGVLSVRTFMEGESTVVEVSDDGPGIPPDIAGRIFEPFFTTRSGGAGTGLGLSTSFGIAKAHAGSLSMVPRAGGACFRLTLPGAGFPGPAVGTIAG